MATGACVLLLAIGATVLFPWLGKVAMTETVAERTFEAGTAIDWDTGIGLKVSVPQSSTERKVAVRRSTPEQPKENFIAFHSVYDITLGSDSKSLEKFPVTLSFKIPDGVDPQATAILYWKEDGWTLAENKQGDPGGTVSVDSKYISITREGASRYAIAEWLYKNILRHFDNLPEPPPPSPIIQVKGTQPSSTYPGYLVSEVTLDSPVIALGLGGTWYQIDVSGKDHVKLEGDGYLAPGTKRDLKIIFPSTGGQARVCLNTKGALPRAALDWADRLGLPTEDVEFLVEIVERFQDRPANWSDLIWVVKNRLVGLLWKVLGAEIKFYANLIPVSIDMATYINAITDSRPDSCVDVFTRDSVTLAPTPRRILTPTPTHKLPVAPTPTLMPRATVTTGTSLPLLRTLIGHGGNVNAVAFSPDGTMLASVSKDYTVRLWRVSDGTLLRTLRREGGGGEGVSVAFSPDGAMVASGTMGTDASIHLWRVSDGTPLRTFRDKDQESPMIMSLAFSPDGATLASSGPPTLWRVSDGVLLRRLGCSWCCVAFSPNWAMFATGDWGQDRVWVSRLGDTVPLYMVGSGREYGPGCRQAAFSPDGTTLATNESVGVRLWRVSDGLPLRTLTQIGAGTMAFSPDWSMLALGSYTGIVPILRVTDGALLHMLAAHWSPVYGVAFSPDGTILATGSEDYTVRLWRVRP
jgi:WD40 repeat protein